MGESIGTIIATIWMLSPFVLGFFLYRCSKKNKKSDVDKYIELNFNDDIENDIEDYEEFIEYRYDDLKVQFDYVDAKDEKTTRRVKVNSVDDEYLRGWCYERSASRTFRLDRIVKLYDKDGKKVKDIMGFFKDAYEKSSDYILMNYIDEHIDLLKVLIYLVKADGRYSAKEKVVVRKFLRDMTEIDFEDALIDKIMKSITAPSFEEFKSYVDELSSRENRYNLIKVTEDIIGTQNTVHPNEQQALDYIKMVENKK